MGNINKNLYLKYKQTYLKDSFKSFNKADWGGDNFILDTVDLNSEYINLYAGSITTSNILYMRNIGVNDVHISFDAGNTSIFLIKSGEYGVMTLKEDYPISTILAKASNGAGILEYLFFENESNTMTYLPIGEGTISTTFRIF